MKKILILSMITFCAAIQYIGCDKEDYQKPAAETTATIDEGSNPAEPDDEISFRACMSCLGCCCILTAVSPTDSMVFMSFCGALFPGDFCSNCCDLGNGTGCGPTTMVNRDTVTLLIDSPDDFKEFCSGAFTVPFVITNHENFKVNYTLDCGGPNDPINIELLAGESAHITKDANCSSSFCKF